MNELQLNLVGAARGYTTVYAGDRYPYHGNFVPGDANSMGYEDLKVIEDYEFCQRRRRPPTRARLRRGNRLRQRAGRPVAVVAVRAVGDPSPASRSDLRREY